MKSIASDRKRVSKKQLWEPATVAKRFKITAANVRKAIEDFKSMGGHSGSRKELYFHIEAMISRGEITPKK